MKTLYKNGMLVRFGKAERLDMLVEGNKIAKIAPDIGCEGCEAVDLAGKRLLPKLFDEHTHGANGYDFNTATLEQMRDILDFYIEQNVGTVFPTVMTSDVETMSRQLALIDKLAQEYPEIKGIHLEGPFLSSEYKGAMPESLLQRPSIELFDKLQKSAGGRIRLITLSPELDGAPELTKALVSQGVTVNMGHSGADSAAAQRCLDAGATGFTHTFNAMKLMHQHHLNIGGLAMLSDGMCEIICDGRHLNGEVVRLLLKVKGIDQLVLITDSIMAAGLPDGQYTLGGDAVTVKDGDALLTDSGVRAGSTCTAMEALKKFSEFTSLPVEQAVEAFTINPARHNRLDNITGSLEEGKLAEFFICE